MPKSNTMIKLRDDIYETIMEFRLGDMGYGDFVERIIALFPKLIWVDRTLYLNNVWVGYIGGNEDGGYCAYTGDDVKWFSTYEEAVQGLERCVREELGWDS